MGLPPRLIQGFGRRRFYMDSPRNFFLTIVRGSAGRFQLSDLAGLGHGLGIGFWVVFTIIVSLTLSLPTNLTLILP